MQSDKEKFKSDFIKRLVNFSLKILKLTGLIKKEPNLWSLSDQLIRCSTSIGANVVEAKSSSSKKEYINYFQISLKSANETKYWLLLLREHKKGDKISEEADKLLQEAEEISNILGSSILTLKNKK